MYIAAVILTNVRNCCYPNPYRNTSTVAHRHFKSTSTIDTMDNKPLLLVLPRRECSVRNKFLVPSEVRAEGAYFGVPQREPLSREGDAFDILMSSVRSL